MQFFQELGSLVERRWRDEDYCEEVFPEIAEQALAETSPHEQVDPWSIIRWLNTSTHIPWQQDVDGNFGNPPITLYCGPRFYIDVYFWLDGTTTIHRHAFSGAFQVFLGSSILSEYNFSEEKKINAHFSAGQIDLKGVELLELGSIKRILAGGEYIHSLFHLDRPSATIVIRTIHTPSGMPQYNYHKPHFAIDPFYKSPSMIKKGQSASLLLGMNHPEVDDLISELVSCSDFQTTFSILDLAFSYLTNNRLEKAFGLSDSQERFQTFLEIARRRHGGLVDLIPPILEEAKRQHNLVFRRGQITSSEHRFFLALLLNVPDRGRVLELVKQRFPQRDAVDTIIDWVESLANTKLMGSPEANVLGIGNFDEDYLFILRCLLEGLSLERTKQIAQEEYAGEDTEDLSGKLEELYHSIQHSMIFKAIFLNPLATAPGKAVRDHAMLVADNS